MTSRTPVRQSYQQAQSSMPSQPFGEAMGAMVPLQAICSDCLTAYASMGTEAMRFWQMRLNKDMALLKDLASCRDPMQALDCQFRFYSQMLQDYLGESAKMFSLATATDDPQFKMPLRNEKPMRERPSPLQERAA